MTNFTAPAVEVLEVLQQFNYTVMMYGADGNNVVDPEKARRFFARPENLLVSLVDEGDDSILRVYIGIKTEVVDILGLLDTLRTAATKFNLLFNVSEYGKEIDPKDFAGEATVEEAVLIRAQSERIAERIMRRVRRR